MLAWNSFSYICTRALHFFRSFAHWRAASTAIPQLPKASFTSSMQPNLGLPRTRTPITSAIITLLAIRYSSILFKNKYSLQELIFFTWIGILYKNGYSLQEWGFFTIISIPYKNGYSLQEWVFFTIMGILYKNGYSL